MRGLNAPLDGRNLEPQYTPLYYADSGRRHVHDSLFLPTGHNYLLRNLAILHLLELSFVDSLFMRYYSARMRVYATCMIHGNYGTMVLMRMYGRRIGSSSAGG